MEGLFGSIEEFLLRIYQIFSVGNRHYAAVIIGITITIAFISALKILRKPANERTLAAETVRLSLARSLLLVLDFVVASDILKTILVPSLSELSLLAFIVAIRIALSWSLSKELTRHTDHMKQ